MSKTENLADLSIKSITTLCGLHIYKNVIDPTDPSQMAKNIKITFKPLPFMYFRVSVRSFRKKLKIKLEKAGVQVVPWKEATLKVKGAFLRKIFPQRKVKAEFHAVVDVKKDYSIFRKILSHIVAERIYSFKRSPDTSIMEILKIGGWADDFTLRKVQAPFATQIITLFKLKKNFTDIDVPYDKKIAIGLNNLIGTMSEIVIGVTVDKFSIINMNLSDSVYNIGEMDSFLLKSLIPKIYAPIRPPMLNRFKIEEYTPLDYPFTRELTELGHSMDETNLYPQGIQLSKKIKRLSLRDALNKFLDGRTGVSYGFIAMTETPKYYDGSPYITYKEWQSLTPVEELSPEEVRQNEQGRWYVRNHIRNTELFQQVPDIWIVTSRSGCDKTHMEPDRDVIRIGLIKGKLTLQIPANAGMKRKDIRPSFDTEVMLAQSLATALYLPHIMEKGMPILHFHGYPNPRWFHQEEQYVGEQNPSLPCGTMEAALLNYSGIYELAKKDVRLKMFCLVESDHGVNILGIDKDYLVERLKEGVINGDIHLGGKYLPALKNSSRKEAASL